MYKLFIAALFIIDKRWGQKPMSINKLMIKQIVVYSYSETLYS